VKTAINIDDQLDRSFRHSYSKIVSLLMAKYGAQQLELIENAVMDAYYKALKSWPLSVIPDNQQAWLYRAAHNSLIDEYRKRQKYDERELSDFSDGFDDNRISEDDYVKDPELKLLFLICHPQLSKEDQLAFMLKTMSGLGDKEISRALMVKQTTIKKRLMRARVNIRDQGLQFDWPEDHQLPSRLVMVHTALYSLFSEGFYSSHHEQWIRKDLCLEAMRLCKYLAELPLADTDTYALLSLMCYHISRYESRLDDDNNVILLKDQDRGKWDSFFINLGHHYLRKSAEQSNRKTKYQLEAFISAQHCLAKSIEHTNWSLLKELYQALYRIDHQDMVLLNLIVVHLHLGEVTEAKDLFDKLTAEDFLHNKTVYYMVGVEVYSKLKDQFQIELLIEKAIRSSSTEKESNFLKSKLGSIKSDPMKEK